MGLPAALLPGTCMHLCSHMRAAETWNSAMKAAETGHLLISTLHTPDAVTTVSRLVSMFPPEEQEITCVRLSEALQAGASQRLLSRGAGQGRPRRLRILIGTRPARRKDKNPQR